MNYYSQTNSAPQDTGTSTNPGIQTMPVDLNYHVQEMQSYVYNFQGMDVNANRAAAYKDEQVELDPVVDAKLMSENFRNLSSV